MMQNLRVSYRFLRLYQFAYIKQINYPFQKAPNQDLDLKNQLFETINRDQEDFKLKLKQSPERLELHQKFQSELEKMKSLSALKGIILLYADILKYDDLDFWKRVLAQSLKIINYQEKQNKKQNSNFFSHKHYLLSALNSLRRTKNFKNIISDTTIRKQIQDLQVTMLNSDELDSYFTSNLILNIRIFKTHKLSSALEYSTQIFYQNLNKFKIKDVILILSNCQQIISENEEDADFLFERLFLPLNNFINSDIFLNFLKIQLQGIQETDQKQFSFLIQKLTISLDRLGLKNKVEFCQEYIDYFEKNILNTLSVESIGTYLYFLNGDTKLVSYASPISSLSISLKKKFDQMLKNQEINTTEFVYFLKSAYANQIGKFLQNAEFLVNGWEFYEEFIQQKNKLFTLSQNIDLLRVYANCNYELQKPILQILQNISAQIMKDKQQAIFSSDSNIQLSEFINLLNSCQILNEEYVDPQFINQVLLLIKNKITQENQQNISISLYTYMNNVFQLYKIQKIELIDGKISNLLHILEQIRQTLDLSNILKFQRKSNDFYQKQHSQRFDPQINIINILKQLENKKFFTVRTESQIYPFFYFSDILLSNIDETALRKYFSQNFKGGNFIQQNQSERFKQLHIEIEGPLHFLNEEKNFEFTGPQGLITSQITMFQVLYISQSVHFEFSQDLERYLIEKILNSL